MVIGMCSSSPQSSLSSKQLDQDDSSSGTSSNHLSDVVDGEANKKGLAGHNFENTLQYQGDSYHYLGATSQLEGEHKYGWQIVNP